MSGLFMRLSRRFVPVDFDENKVTRIIQLLNDIESRDSWLQDARARILDRCLTESLREFGFYADMNMND